MAGIGITAGLAIVLSANAAQAPHAAEHASIRSQLVGTWELVSSEDHLKDGSIRAYPDAGPHGKGFLLYTAEGYMCAQLMNPDRAQWKDEDEPTDAQKISAFDGFSSYCGQYEVNEAEAIVYHLPKTASYPPYVGTRQRRPATLRGDTLTFADKTDNEGDVASYVIVWRRVSGARS